MVSSRADNSSKPEGPAVLISWPGYGIWFFWQLGVLQYLEWAYDLSTCTMVGSSAGALLSVLAACNVKPQAALDLAHDLCIRHNVFQRPLGLIGVWGGIVKEWLQELLPMDAAERCSGGHVRIVLTTLPLLRRKVVTEFEDRDDLISCALASAHLPFILDWQACALWRGQRCIDGSMLYILTRRCAALRPTGGSPLLLFDPLGDLRTLLNPYNLVSCISLCGKESAQQLLDQGVEYARKMDSAGHFAALARHRKHTQQDKFEPQCHIQPSELELGSRGMADGVSYSHSSSSISESAVANVEVSLPNSSCSAVLCDKAATAGLS